MADYDAGREAHKQRLRANIISNEETGGKDEKRLSPLVFVVILLAAALLGGAVYFVNRHQQSASYSVLWEREPSASSGGVETFSGYTAFADGIIKYTKDGAEYVDKNGSVIWERSYQMTSPIAAVSDGYAAIADQSGSQIYIFDDKQITGSSETALPISRVCVSDNGVVYAVLNDSSAEYITAFRSDGNAIDLSIKSVITGDGYPFDVSVSKDGTQLITSYITVSNGQIENKVVFRNFGAIGQNEDARRVVGGFSDEFDGHMVGRVHFSDDEYSQAFYDGGIVFFSTEVLNTPEVLSNVSFDARIESIAESERLVAAVADGADGEAAASLRIFSSSGKELGSADIDFEYSGMCISDTNVVLYDSGNIHVFRQNGTKRAELSFDGGKIVSICGTESGSELGVVTDSSMCRIKF